MEERPRERAPARKSTRIAASKRHTSRGRHEWSAPSGASARNGWGARGGRCRRAMARPLRESRAKAAPRKSETARRDAPAPRRHAHIHFPPLPATRRCARLLPTCGNAGWVAVGAGRCVGVWRRRRRRRRAAAAVAENLSRLKARTANRIKHKTDTQQRTSTANSQAMMLHTYFKCLVA